MTPSGTFYWYDYETWGTDPRRDRVAQFAGLRTDLEFNELDKPLVCYARPADDFLPHPEACLVTGLTPQLCRDEGIPEAEFFTAIEAEMARPGTCTLGYNSIRFDDEFTRNGLYRNYFDPYAREWQNGNSRWDLIDVVRLTRALRPDGIQWPTHEDGVTSFRLEELTVANDIPHVGAHDALSDVRATIALARLVQQRQPKLFRYAYEHRDKQTLRRLLDPSRGMPVLHVSARYPARLGCIAAVLPLARHPQNQNEIIVYDLRADPHDLLRLGAEAIRQRLYTPSDQLPAGTDRIALKSVKVNHAPVVAPMNTLTPAARELWQMPEAAETVHLDVLRAALPDLAKKLAEVFARSPFGASEDPDLALYDGFIPDADRRRCEQVRQRAPEQLAGEDPGFEDPRLAELYFRYRARNWPETLNRGEREQWELFRRARLTGPEGSASLHFEDYRKRLSQFTVDTSLTDDQRKLINALIDWPAEIGLV